MPANDADTVTGGSAVRYPTTIWSSVFESEDRCSERFRERLARLLDRYWKPIYRTIRITWGKNNEDAKDLTQSFLLMVVQDDFVSRFRAERGRFRSFLKAALSYFLSNEEKARRRLKRGGGRIARSLDGEEEAVLEPGAVAGSPDEVFDREWADALVEESIEELRRELTRKDREILFRVYEAIDLSTDPERPPTYRQTAARLGISESDVTHYLHEARRRLRAILVKNVGEYASDEDEIYDELSRIYMR